MDVEDLNKRIEEYLHDEWGQMVNDIASLVSIESVEDLSTKTQGAPFGKGPRAALDAALAIARRLGLSTHDCEGYMGYADLPGTTSHQVGIIGHLDVVPAGSGWHFDPFAVTRKEGYLIGRGVGDDKGPVIVALHAVAFWRKLLAERGEAFPCTVRMLFGANEETSMQDVAYYRAHYPDPDFLFTPDAEFPVCYGEAGICSGIIESAPLKNGDLRMMEGGSAVNAVAGTASAVVRAERAHLRDMSNIQIADAGDGLVRIDAVGKSAHASTPEEGENAIGMLVDYLLANDIGTSDERAFLGFMQRLLSRTDGSGLGIQTSDEHFGAFTAVGGMVSLHQGRLRLTIDCRYPTTTSAHDIEERINERASSIGAHCTIDRDREPFLLDPNSPAVQALITSYNEATGENARPFTMKGGTYARMFTHAASFGPDKPWVKKPAWAGNMHSADECVSDDLLKEAFSIYVRTIRALMPVVNATC